CGDNTILILDDGVHQPVIIPFPIECNEIGDCEETALGAANGEGCNFPGSNWAPYFEYSDGAQ
ncbi:MAG TPA: hypothetical protein VIS27_14350, partial [Yeosuana sp.]